MNLSISNIGWAKESDIEMYEFLSNSNIKYLEIAPTRIIDENPYDKLEEAKVYFENLKTTYGLEVSSMQSIWFGKSEQIFNSDEEMLAMNEYTKKAIIFAKTIGCRNLVFGCPKNRNIPEGYDYKKVINFFKDLGDFAYNNGTILSMEANPNIYGTNFVNTTKDALELVKQVNSKGFMCNFDLGTVINNNEDITSIDFSLVNHIHISEPFLNNIEWSEIHKQLANILKSVEYNKCISIEMKNLDDINIVKNNVIMLKEMF